MDDSSDDESVGPYSPYEDKCLGMDDSNRPKFIMGDEVLVCKNFTIDTQSLDEQIPPILVGVCAMEKKTHSKPMREILGRLDRFEHIKIVIFEESVILNKSVEDWPIVDVLISFFSSGFPLDKAIAYKNLRKPFLVNNLEEQYDLLDRRKVYNILKLAGIDHPRYAIYNHEEGKNIEDLKCSNDNEDAIEIDGLVFTKPFVEKPVSAEDHNVYIYFPASAGGGSQRLFRKVGTRSSIYCSVSDIRKSGAYIYEDFMPTDGTDVKVYTVGPDYAHAEARKSPALDGKVERDKEGKEVRYPVILSAKEKLLARKVCLAFKQNVCGFDLLRANGKSYVCDVNGFSFVKNSTKYYDDCAKILGTMIMRALAPQHHIPWVLGAAPEDIPVVPTTTGSMMELRCVVAVVRHGDRTPKQKMKMEVKHKKFFELFKKYDGYKSRALKLKKPKQLQEILDIARFLLSENVASSDPEVMEKKAKLQQLKLVLEMYGHFSGINRKVQLKYQPYGHPKKSSSDEDTDTDEVTDMDAACESNDGPRQPSLLLIVKWGGELTPAGRQQAEDLGKAFRTLYPGGEGQFESPGLGFLRLHSTFRHDLKIYASDEGRVQMTAAAFAKGLLALEGELTPILVQMVKSANTNGLLDKQGETSKYQQIVKERLLTVLNENKEFADEDSQKLCPTAEDQSHSLRRAMEAISNPRKMCENIHVMVQELTAKVKLLKLEHRTRDLKLYHGESWELLIRRWAKLEKDFKMKDGRFDISKIPDIYDCIKYDLQHNQTTLQYGQAEELFRCSRAMADIVVPQEYGVTVQEKQHISQSLCTPLMRKIRSDLQQCVFPTDEDESTRLNSRYSKDVASPERFVRTRLYFTSESHIHSLLNMFRYGGLCDVKTDSQWEKACDYLNKISELNYMTQIVIMMFEDPSKEITSDDRFHIELHFSPGANILNERMCEFPSGLGCRSLSHKDQKKEEEVNGVNDMPPTMKTQDLHNALFTESGSPRRLLLERPVSAPMVIQEAEEDLQESDIFDQGHQSDVSLTPAAAIVMPEPLLASSLEKKEVDNPDLGVKAKKEGKKEGFAPKEAHVKHDVVGPGGKKFFRYQVVKVPEPQKPKEKKKESSTRSPDPSTPEWDWGDDTPTCSKEVKPALVKEAIVKEVGFQESSTSIPASERSSGTLSRNNSNTSVSTPIEINAKSKDKETEVTKPRSNSVKNEVGRSQSYEDKRSRSLEDKPIEVKESHEYHVERQYLTVQFPLAKHRQRHSWSSLFYLGPENVQDEDYENKEDLFPRSKSFAVMPRIVAFERFNVVPSLRPLETLHNRLTMRGLDSFLARATTCQSLPSSSNSSAGPSSPTSSSTPSDLATKLRLYMLENQNDSVASTTTNQIEVSKDSGLISPNYSAKTPTSMENMSSCVLSSSFDGNHLHKAMDSSAEYDPDMTLMAAARDERQPVKRHWSEGEV